MVSKSISGVYLTDKEDEKAAKVDWLLSVLKLSQLGTPVSMFSV